MIKNYNDIQGWFDFENLYQAMVQATPDNVPIRFCEVGCWLGKSTAYLASLIKQYKPNIQLWVVDSFKGDGTTDFQSDIVAKCGGSIIKAFQQNMQDLGLTEVITEIVEASSIDAVTRLPDFDFIFIDADHKYLNVMADMVNYWSLVKPGGVLGGHDYNGETAKAVNAFAKCLGRKVTGIGSSWLMQKD